MRKIIFAQAKDKHSGCAWIRHRAVANDARTSIKQKYLILSAWSCHLTSELTPCVSTWQVLSGIRTVASLTSEDLEIERYAGHLDGAYKAGIKEGVTKGIGNGALFTSFYFSYALAFWFGTRQVRAELCVSCCGL